MGDPLEPMAVGGSCWDPCLKDGGKESLLDCPREDGLAPGDWLLPDARDSRLRMRLPRGVLIELLTSSFLLGVTGVPCSGSAHSSSSRAMSARDGELAGSGALKASPSSETGAGCAAARTICSAVGCGGVGRFQKHQKRRQTGRQRCSKNKNMRVLLHISWACASISTNI